MFQITKIRRKFRQKTLRFLLNVTIQRRRFWTRFLAKISRFRFLNWTIFLSLLLTFICAELLYRHYFQWKANSRALATAGTVSALEIAIGAAVLGVIGIIFSLSIFSIQQVAERGTSLTIREYARDWVFNAVYWTLAIFAFLAMTSALQKSDLALLGICFNLVILAAIMLVLKIYFNRVTRFIDPHFTITKVARRARRSLNEIQRIERMARDEIRYQRARSGN